MNNPSTASVSIWSLLFRHSPRLLTFAAIVGAAAGALYSLIIPFVLGELARQNGTPGAHPVPAWLAGHAALAYFVVCMLILTAKASSIILVNNIAKSATAELRLSIAARIGGMTTDGVERIGFPRLLAVLVDDVNKVSAAAVAIPMILVAAVTVVGMLGYLATINLLIFGVIVVCIVVGVAMFQIPMSVAGGVYRQARALRDVIQEGARGLITGVYELKLDPAKAARYLDDEIVAPQRASVKLEKRGDAMLHLAGTSSDLLSLFIIGMIVFVVPRYLILGATDAVGVVMALLYIAAPVASILGMLSHLEMGQIAVARIRKLADDHEEVGGEADARFAGWTRFGVHEASYAYRQPDSDEPGFGLAPVSLEFARGQINFIVGGNGSGKSTLSKLISLHYRPLAGHVYFDGAKVDAASLRAARSRIAVIYSNYYLFRKLYRPVSVADQEKIDRWLDALGLTGKTAFENGQFTTTRLSDGQRRRLALLVALLDDKDIYIFDEWAADQDPEFKRIFYREILQDMKRDNKLVIVITHDDRYFACADRLIFMESGRLSAVRDPAAVPALATESDSAALRA
jgi:putative ATP-binding cassette transporter